ncbi:hypothetical protein CVT26_015897 [Gymnopilus dilepis]|uniref:Uncharacterized protein n=1 Tax=Gymnopilus dilepis TaxID=231916 RepID=A0A409WHT1_9AGAR|nr:hypothetical protein CVT26_015897 [Gymnopilus dilepis]
MASILNDDLLYAICSACPRSTLVNLCLVSSTCYIAAMPYLLREVTFRRSSELLLRFIHFILENSTSSYMSAGTSKYDHGQVSSTVRLRYITDPGKHVRTFSLFDEGCHSALRSAIVNHNVYDEDVWARLLTKALALMPNLQSVYIESRLESICEHSREFAAILLTRPRLRSLNVRSPGQFASRGFREAIRVRNLKSDPLKLKVVVFSGSYDDVPIILHPGYGLGALIFACRDSLEELRCADCNMSGLLSTSDGLARSTRRIVYPNVGKIYLHKEPQVDVESFALSFPSLRALFLPAETPAFVKGISARRAAFRNLASLTSRGFAAVASFLQRVDPPPRLHHLVMWKFSTLPVEADSQADIDFVVNNVFPMLRSFVVKIRRPHIYGPGQWDVFSRSLRSLRYLSLYLWAYHNEEIRVLDVLNPEMLSSIPLEYFSLTYTAPAATGGLPLYTTPEAPISRHGIALAYAKSIRSLQFIDLCERLYVGNSHYTTVDVTNWWKILRTESPTDDDTQCVKLEALEERMGSALRDQYDDPRLKFSGYPLGDRRLG